MSDTVLALIITVVLLLTLAAWVPLLHAAERLTRRNVRLLETRRSTAEKERVRKDGREVA